MLSVPNNGHDFFTFLAVARNPRPKNSPNAVYIAYQIAGNLVLSMNSANDDLTLLKEVIESAPFRATPGSTIDSKRRNIGIEILKFVINVSNRFRGLKVIKKDFWQIFEKKRNTHRKGQP